ncbi:MAG: hypothetical protein HY223_08585 [Thaumarchaeota archaeon]|nr:hypothetical protein [Nitrososphaerota archaeon]
MLAKIVAIVLVILGGLSLGGGLHSGFDAFDVMVGIVLIIAGGLLFRHVLVKNSKLQNEKHSDKKK